MHTCLSLIKFSMYIVIYGRSPKTNGGSGGSAHGSGVQGAADPWVQGAEPVAGDELLGQREIFFI